MKLLVAREVIQFIARLNLPQRAVYAGTAFLTHQIQISPGDHDLALVLVDCFINMFESSILSKGIYKFIYDMHLTYLLLIDTLHYCKQPIKLLLFILLLCN